MTEEAAVAVAEPSSLHSKECFENMYLLPGFKIWRNYDQGIVVTCLEE